MNGTARFFLSRPKRLNSNGYDVVDWDGDEQEPIDAPAIESEVGSEEAEGAI